MNLMLTKKLLVIDKITAFCCPTEYICQALNQTVAIKWTLKNSQASTEVYESHNLLQVRPHLCFYRHCYLFGFFNVLNGYLFCFTQFQWWKFLLLEFLENS